jgi:3-methyladenine DNA glycosylase AlkD
MFEENVEIEEITSYLGSLGNSDIAANSQRFFKTAKGEYGHGDKFLGIRMPVIRAAVRHFKNAPTTCISGLICSDFHEIRMFAVLLLVSKYAKAQEADKDQLFALYLHHSQYINNWDLVDCSAHLIVGPHLQNKSREVLVNLAHSESLWERRIAIISTYHYIRQKQFAETLQLAELLLADKQDLIHKAVGWMLREIGNRDKSTELGFLKRHYKRMPRTMLRYAIEKFPEPERKQYLHGTA